MRERSSAQYKVLLQGINVGNYTRQLRPLAFQDEMVSMAALWRETLGFGFSVVWRHHLFAVRTGSRVCKDTGISEGIVEINGPPRSLLDGHTSSFGKKAHFMLGCF